MSGRSVLSAFGLWLLLLAVAVTAGALRESLLTPSIGGHAAHVVGTMAVAVIMAAIIAIFVRCGPTRSSVARWSLGLFWLVLTVCFEFVFGHYVAGQPWETLLADYNVFAGRLWPLILATLLFTPVIAGQSR